MQQRRKTLKFLLGGYGLATLVSLVVMILPPSLVWYFLSPGSIFWQRLLAMVICFAISVVSTFIAVFCWLFIASIFE